MLEQEQLIFDAVEIIDEHLRERAEPLKGRPLIAALEFVRIWILDVSHGSKDNPWEEPWFAIIYHHVQDWYQKTYGQAFEHDKDFGVGVVVIPTALLIDLCP